MLPPYDVYITVNIVFLGHNAVCTWELYADQSKYRYDALEAFIQSQKTLLARTESDIQRLRRLREDASAVTSNDELEDFIENLGDNVSEQPVFDQHNV